MAFRLGMLGCLHTHATGIVRQVALHPDEFSLEAIFDVNPQVFKRRREEWTSILPSLRACSSADELLSLKLDGVIVESQQYDNLRMASLALSRGLPVLLEKPAGENLAEHRALVSLARSKGLHLQMAYLFRYMVAVLRMRSLFTSGKLGAPYLFRARLPKDVTLYDSYVDELGRYPGGIFFEMGGHAIDLMVSMLGPPSRVTPFQAHHHSHPGKFIDNGLAVFGFERAWGTVEVTALEGVPGGRRFEIHGTGGSCIIPHLGSGHLKNNETQAVEYCLADEGIWHREEILALPLQISDLREFAAVVRKQKQPDYSLDHDLAVQEALLKASGHPI